MIIDDAVGEQRVLPPRFVQQLLPVQHAAAIAYESRQHFELGGRDVYYASGAPHLATRVIDLHVAKAVNIRLCAFRVSS